MKLFTALVASTLAVAAICPAKAEISDGIGGDRQWQAECLFLPILQKFKRSERTLDQSVTGDQGRYYKEEAQLRAPLERQIRSPFALRALTDADLKYDVKPDGYYRIIVRQVVRIKNYSGRLDWRGRRERASLQGPVLTVPCELRYVQVVRVRVFTGNVHDKSSWPRPLGNGVLHEEPVDLWSLLKGSHSPAR